MRPNSIAGCAILAILALPACGGNGGNDPTNPDTSIVVAALVGTYVVDLTIRRVFRCMAFDSSASPVRLTAQPLIGAAAYAKTLAVSDSFARKGRLSGIGDWR